MVGKDGNRGMRRSPLTSPIPSPYSKTLVLNPARKGQLACCEHRLGRNIKMDVKRMTKGCKNAS
jgi:hypothetical protein